MREKEAGDYKSQNAARHPGAGREAETLPLESLLGSLLCSFCISVVSAFLGIRFSQQAGLRGRTRGKEEERWKWLREGDVTR